MTPRLTHIANSGKIIQSLNASTIGVLLFSIDDTITYQNEMAERLGCTPAPVTTSLQSLEELPIPLVEKQRRYQVTEAGETVIGLLDEHILQLGMDLCDIDWGSDEEKDKLNELLKPLQNSLSLRPFVILDVLYRDSGEMMVDRLIADVQACDDESTAVSRRQIKSTLERFDNAESIKLDGDTVSLTEHGEKQGRMLVDFIKFSKQQHGNDEKGGGADRIETETGDGFFIPAYRPRGDNIGPAIPILSSTTIEELYQHVSEVRQQCGGETELDLVWMKENLNVTT